MGTDDVVQTADSPDAGPTRSVAALRREERIFWVGLACAAVLHLVLIVGVGRSASLARRMGEPTGSFDGISVDLVDAADIMSRTNVPTKEPGTAQPPQPPAEAARPAPPAPKQEPAPKQQDKSAVTAIEEQVPDLFSLPDPTGKQSGSASTAKSASKPQQQQQQQQARPDMATAPSGLSAGVTRPPGVTRSGENDEFGRGVIRALRKTMPLPRGVTGRVTIRFFLSETGNIVDLNVVRSAGDPVLDQSVAFAARQSSFPLPPVGASVADRTFLVTYIYQ